MYKHVVATFIVLSIMPSISFGETYKYRTEPFGSYISIVKLEQNDSLYEHYVIHKEAINRARGFTTMGDETVFEIIFIDEEKSPKKIQLPFKDQAKYISFTNNFLRQLSSE